MSDEPNETSNEPTPTNENPNETPPVSPEDNPPENAAKAAKARAKKKKDDPKDPDATPDPTPAETPVEPPEQPVPVDPAPDTTQPGSVLEELSERVEQPAAESRNELVFDPSTGELVVKPKGEAVGSDAVIVSEIADEGFFAEAR